MKRILHGQNIYFRTYTSLYLVLITCLVLLVATPFTVAQAPQAAFVFTPSVQVGGTPQTQTVPVMITAAAGNYRVQSLTQGSPGWDFTSDSVVACAGSPCSVPVSFLPKYPGLRVGAVLLFDSNNNLIGSRNLSGIGVGSLSAMSPGEINTLAGDGCPIDGTCPTGGSTPATIGHGLKLPSGAATDAAGNIYISDTENSRILKVSPDGNTISTIAGSDGVSGSAGDGGAATSALINTPYAIAVDGAGNIFFADTGNNAIREINVTTNNISTVAGTLSGTPGFAGDGSAATSASLASPQGLTFDASGNLYIADTGNNRIRKVDSSTGIITTIAGTGVPGFLDNATALLGEFNQPTGIAVGLAADGSFSLYIADFGNNRIRKIDMTTGLLSTVAGNGLPGYTGDKGSALSATLNSPTSVAIDAAGNLYIADFENSVIRKVNASTSPAIITTLAGSGTAPFVGDGFDGDGFDANLAGLTKPYSVYLDGLGDIVLSDTYNLRVREISANLAGINYPDMKEGKTSLPIAQTVENEGNAPLNFTNLAAAPATMNAVLDLVATDPITTTCLTSAALPIGSDCVLAVEFTPPTVSPVSGVLSVTSDSGNSPIAVDLSGNVLSVNPTSTTITSSLNPAGVGLAVTLTALVSNGNQGNSTGTVQFFDGAVSIGSQAVNANAAVLTTSFTTVGPHIITAVYSGDNLNAASTPTSSHPLTETIEQATTLNVVSSANPDIEFTPITFTATLAVQGGSTVPTGSITFADGTTPLGSPAPLNGSGVASFAVPPLAVGAHHITASYAGDGTSFSSQFSFTQTITLAPTSTALSSSATMVQFSTPVTFTATVTGVPADTPTGSVQFKDGATILATVPVNALGVATYVNTTLLAGLHAIIAVYRGDSNYAGSTSAQAISVSIQQTPTNTMLATSATNSIATKPVTISATVTTAGGSTIPAGNVNFMSGSILLGTASLNNKGVASVTTASLAVGTDNITAIYLGDSNDTGSTSAPLAITIVQAPTTTTVSSSQNPLQTLTPVIISATVANGGTQNATGVVTFKEDSATVGTGALNANGIATVSLPSLTVGSHTFVASYAGDALNLPSLSAPFTQVVQLRPTTDVLTTSESSLTGGQQLTLISVIHPTGGAGSVAPTGTVTFMDGSTTLATSAVDGTGVATVTVLLSESSANLSSTYSGDANYAASSSSLTTVPIGPAPDFSLQATPTAWQMQSKQHLAINVTLTSVKNFTDTFALGCSGLPQYATCSFSQDKTDLPAGGSQSVTLTVDTGDPLLSGTQAHNDDVPKTKIIFACLFPGSLAFGLLSFRLRRVRWAGGLLLIAVLAMTSALSGCGSIQNSGTAPGTYNFLVTATGQTGVQQFVNMTMTITK
jgi:sugar lactone lactonase YvrE